MIIIVIVHPDVLADLDSVPLIVDIPNVHPGIFLRLAADDRGGVVSEAGRSIYDRRWRRLAIAVGWAGLIGGVPGGCIGGYRPDQAGDQRQRQDSKHN